jgi:hypothetical protein
MSPSRRHPRNSQPAARTPAKRRPRPERIGSPRCPLKHTRGQREAAGALRALLRRLGFWDYLTRAEQIALEEACLHATWSDDPHHRRTLSRSITPQRLQHKRRGLVTIYQATLATALNRTTSTTREIEHHLEHLGYWQRILWRENKTRLRRAYWLYRPLAALLTLNRLSYPVRQHLWAHLIEHHLRDGPRITRYLASRPDIHALWEALLGRPISIAGPPAVVRSLLTEREAPPPQGSTSSLRSSVTDLPSGSPPVNPAQDAGSSASLRPPVTGDSPSGPASAEGFHPPLHDGAHPQQEFWELWARFWSKTHTDLRTRLRLELDPDELPEPRFSKRLTLTHTIARELPCDHHDAYDLLMRYARILHHRRLQDPAAPRGRPAATVTDLRGNTWVLAWQPPARDTSPPGEP